MSFWSAGYCFLYSFTSSADRSPFAMLKLMSTWQHNDECKILIDKERNWFQFCEFTPLLESSCPSTWWWEHWPCRGPWYPPEPQSCDPREPSPVSAGEVAPIVPPPPSRCHWKINSFRIQNYTSFYFACHVIIISEWWIIALLTFIKRIIRCTHKYFQVARKIHLLDRFRQPQRGLLPDIPSCTNPDSQRDIQISTIFRKNTPGHKNYVANIKVL